MKSRDGFWVYVLVLSLILLIGSALFIPASENIIWSSPLTLGWLDLSFCDNWYNTISVCLSLAFSALITFSAYILYEKVASYTFSFKYIALFLLLFIYSNPASIYFSPIFVASLALLWAQTSYINSKKFLSMFLVSFSAICYAPLIWAIPLVFILALIQQQNFLKNLIIILTGLICPFVYLLAFRFFMFSDLSFFIDEYIREATTVKLFYSLNFSVLFQLACIVIISLIVITRILMRFNRFKVFNRDVLKIEMVALLINTTIFFIFSSKNSFPLVILLAPSWAFIYSFYLINIEGNKRSYVEMILIISAFFIARLSYFVLPG